MNTFNVLNLFVVSYWNCYEDFCVSTKLSCVQIFSISTCLKLNMFFSVKFSCP